MLHIESVTKTFGSASAVDKVSFEIKAGEIYSLIGPNGSGKTTVIKMIAGLLRPTSGSVRIGDFDAVKEPEEAKSLIGYIPDEPVIWSKMTGGEFLHFAGALYSMPEEARVKRIPELLAHFNLNGIEQEYFEQYSRGNKQKFSILAALLHEPKLLLIDEPIVGLDPTSAETARRLFADFAKSGGAVLLATHTLSVAQELSTRIGVLKQGKLVASDKLDVLRRQAGLSSNASLEDIYRSLTA